MRIFRITVSSLLLISLVMLFSCSPDKVAPPVQKKRKVETENRKDRLDFERRMKRIRDRRAEEAKKLRVGMDEQRKKAEAERILAIENNSVGKARYYAMQAEKFQYKNKKLAITYAKNALELDKNNRQAKEVLRNLRQFYNSVDRMKRKIKEKQREGLRGKNLK